MTRLAQISISITKNKTWSHNKTLIENLLRNFCTFFFCKFENYVKITTNNNERWNFEKIIRNWRILYFARCSGWNRVWGRLELVDDRCSLQGRDSRNLIFDTIIFSNFSKILLDFFKSYFQNKKNVAKFRARKKFKFIDLLRIGYETDSTWYSLYSLQVNAMFSARGLKKIKRGRVFVSVFFWRTNQFFN